MSPACPWCHRYAGGYADHCLFPNSQQCDSERRREDQAHAINDSYNVTYMPAPQFDELLRTLDEPDEAPGLMSALRKTKGAS